MNLEKVYILEDRAILYINGSDSDKYLQNLIPLKFSKQIPWFDPLVVLAMLIESIIEQKLQQTFSELFNEFLNLQKIAAE